MILANGTVWLTRVAGVLTRVVIVQSRPDVITTRTGAHRKRTRYLVRRADSPDAWPLPKLRTAAALRPVPPWWAL